MLSRKTSSLSRNVNILLLGETGVGKSTFINMFGNYLSEKPLEQIASKNCNLLVPTKFSLMNENYVEEIIEIGHSEYELPGCGSSSTQKPQMYVFNDPKHNLVINVIDTPGVGDTRGPEYDKRNAEILLSYISELESIDAFCILLKPDQVRISVQFEVCIKEILEQLDTSIAKHIVFVFTNSRMRHFTTGDTEKSLNTLLEKIKKESGCTIPFNCSNAFCIDNEPFRYIAAKQQGFQFTQHEVEIYKNSFIRSADTIRRMIEYITSLQPAKLQGMTTISESKRIIERLTDSMVVLAVSFENAIMQVNDYNNNLVMIKTDIEYLKKHLYKIDYVPVIIENTENTGKHDFNFGFNPDFLNFTKGFSWGSLLKPFKFVYSVIKNIINSKKVELKERKVLDVDTLAYIKDKESAETAVRAKLDEMNEKCQEYEIEIKTVLTAIANFSSFIDNLKLVAGGDHFKEIMEVIIEEYREDNKGVLIERMTNCLQKYKRIKSQIRKVGAKEIMMCVNDLFSLKHSGPVLKEIIDQKVNFDRVVFNQM